MYGVLIITAIITTAWIFIAEKPEHKAAAELKTINASPVIPSAAPAAAKAPSDGSRLE